MNLRDMLIAQGKAAKKAAQVLAGIAADTKNEVLQAMADAVENAQAVIAAENQKDLEAGERAGLSKALLDRLELNTKRIGAMAQGLRELAKLPDPIGEIVEMQRRPNGLQIGKMRVPLGVVGMVYEARPNVTIDAAGLCFKSGNAVILRGGSEALNSNRILVQIAASVLERFGLPEGSIQLVSSTDREAVSILLGMHEYLDVLIPRGGAGLIQRVINEAKVPVIQTGVGNCHIYIDKSADLEMALKIVDNAKTSRPGVCNAVETLLVHQEQADGFLPQLFKLFEGRVELRGCPKTRRILPQVKAADESDWYAEYLDYILAVKVVGSFDEAVEHINTYGTKHSEAIVTNDYTSSQRFLREVDAAAVYVNASTRFTDGSEFGMGAEIGISTQKLHARGPMALKELTTFKYVIYGQGQTRS
ncbi:MAG: glutamate-5-semialdehyde dehydrogenase [Limnochordia bacterium]|nr:glutamate-5-semialdehyde dehydrogenase [Bacillota bacterium]HOB08123.1 glutamate-5-semialdehyde dehydrogenase [Limnochordia bacterium]NLH30439.1 glutamate-5-semialdehyde dehydrogenase [Bacillota bacterium]HPT93506.1 glutamate-5-semialdehyde dehydrogenase [Limnochordia bacterium]HPZ30182.1 glutamate-5-semialdehyde dehydrogenase [Limnochordia bacterium]